MNGVDFSKLVNDPRDVAAPEGSTNAELLALPQRRTYTHDLKGKLLYFPRTDQVMVAYDYKGDGYYVTVVHNGPNAPKHDGTRGWAAGEYINTPGGHNLYVSNLEMQTAVELIPDEAGWFFERQPWSEPDAQQFHDRNALIQILWRAAMPGFAPLTPLHDDWKHFLADAEAIIESRSGGSATPSIEELSDDDLPGMWSRSDFMGGSDDAEHFARQLDGAARAIAGLSEKLWAQALADAHTDPQTLALVRYYYDRARAVLEAVKA